MKKCLTLCLMLTVMVQVAFTQAGSSVVGKLHDEQQQPVSFATVMLQATADQKLVKAGYTDENGDYELVGIPAGNYTLSVSFLGFQDFKSEAFDLSEGQVFTLPAIRMKEAAKQLEEVIVVAARPIVEIKPDKTVFNVDGTVNATGHTALELLRKAPKVVVDNNDNIMIQGKNGVRVFIDGKPSPLRADDLASYLENMQSNQVDAIEIITNPSSKYDAEGNAGIINIRLKKDKNLGANGSANLGYNIGIYPKYNGSVSFNYRNKTMNLFGSYALNRSHGINFFNLDRYQYGTRYDQENYSQWNRWNNNVRLGVDFFLSKKHTLGALISTNINTGDNFSNSHTDISDIQGGNVYEILIATNTETRERLNLNYNLNYRWEMGKGKSLNIDADYGTFDNDADSYQPNYYMDPGEQTRLNERIYTSYTPTLITIATLKGDHERPLWGGQLSLGAKTSFVNTDNTFDFFNLVNGIPDKDIDRSNRFEYAENVNAAYLNYQNKINDKWSYQLGLRVEQTNSLGDLTAEKPTDNKKVERSYIDPFPSGGLTYQLNPKNSFSLTYSRRIDRPGYQDLNPFQMKLDELSYRQGNPFLRPQYTNSLELSHTFNYRLNTSVGYSHTEDMFAEITDVANDTAGFIKTENLAKQTSVNFNVSMPFSPKKWWNTFTNLSAFRSHTEADFGLDEYGNAKIIDLNVTSFNLYSQHTFLMPKGFSFEVSGFYNSPSVWGGVHQTESMWGMDVGVLKKMMKGKANLKLTFSDIFQTQGWRAKTEFGGLFLRGSGNWESQQFRVNLTYLFGKETVKGARKRKTGMEDETKRVKAGN